MGIAYSPPDKVVHYDIDASSSECLRAGLHTAVQKAGWEVDRAIENGYVYLLTSPQKDTLQCKVRIRDTGRRAIGFGGTVTGPNCIDITFLSFDEMHVSHVFVLGWRGPSDAALFGIPPRRLRLHVTPCQIFTYIPGGFEAGSAVMGGIPFIDPNALEGGEHCADEDNELKTTQAWWACGDLSAAGYFWHQPTFRNHWVGACNSTLHNSELMKQTDAEDDKSLLRLVPPNKPARFMYAYAAINYWAPVMMRWMGTEEPLCFDPLLAWNTNHPVKIRGQFWDAFVRTKHVDPESPLVFEEMPWFAYSSGGRQGTPEAPHWYQTTDISTVYLRDPGVTRLECGHEEEEPPPSLSNYVY